MTRSYRKKSVSKKGSKKQARSNKRKTQRRGGRARYHPSDPRSASLWGGASYKKTLSHIGDNWATKGGKNTRKARKNKRGGTVPYWPGHDGSGRLKHSGWKSRGGKRMRYGLF